MFRCKIMPQIQHMRREMNCFYEVRWITKTQRPTLPFPRRINLIDEQEHYESQLFFEFHCNQKRLEMKEYLWNEEDHVWQHRYTDEAWRWNGCKWVECYYYDPADCYYDK